MPNWAAYAEAYKRGILPPEKSALYNEALQRNLVPQEFLPEQAGPEMLAGVEPVAVQPLPVDVEPVQPRIATGLGREPDVSDIIKEPSFIEQATEFVKPVTEFITGSAEETRATRELPEIGRGGLLAGEEPAKIAAMAGILTTTTNPQELAQILHAQFPHIGIAEDEKGNLIAGNNKTGVQVVLNKPGLSQLDVMQALGLATAFSPTTAVAQLGKGLLAKGAIAGVAAGATEAAIQKQQELAGGEFDEEEIAVAAALGPIAEVAGATVSGIKKIMHGKIDPATKEMLSKGTVLASDVAPPDTFMGKIAQKIAERVPFVGTGGLRAKQQATRVEAVKEIISDFGIDETSEFGKTITDSAKRMFKKSQKRAGELRADAVDQLNDLGAKSPTKTLSAIDEEIRKITAQGKLGDKVLIAELENIKDEVASGTFENLKDIRTLIFDMQRDIGAMKSPLKQGSDKTLSQISGALSKDLNDIAAEIPDAARKWKASNKIFRDNINKAKETELKRILTKGDISPEIVETVIKTGKTSSLKRLHGNLDAEGRKGVRQQIVKNAMMKSLKGDDINPTAFKNELNRNMNQIKVFFKGADAKKLEGLKKFLTVTQRAQEAAADVASKQEVWGMMIMSGAVSAADVIGTAGGVAAGVGVLGRMAESKAVRNLLIRLSNAEKGSRLEKTLIQGLKNAIVSQTEKDQ